MKERAEVEICKADRSTVNAGLRYPLRTSILPANGYSSTASGICLAEGRLWLRGWYPNHKQLKAFQLESAGSGCTTRASLHTASTSMV